MSNTTPNPADLGELVAELQALLEKATPGNLDTAERVTAGVEDCPLCGGEGCLDGDVYVNIDHVAVSVGFYGVGPGFGTLEALWRKLMPALPALLDALASLQAERDCWITAFNAEDKRAFELAIKAGVAEAECDALKAERDAALQSVADWEADRNEWGRQVYAQLDRADQAEAEVAALKAKLERAAEALGYFLADPRFEVAIGGNPIAVEKMIADARAVHAELTQGGGNV